MSSYLVTGATGRQGGAVVENLLAAGAKVHAVVRDPSSAKAIALKDRGVVIFQGTHEEPDQVFSAAAAGCSGLFLNISVFEPGKAKAQAEGIIKACKAGGGATLNSIVLSSTTRTNVFATELAPVMPADSWLNFYYPAKAEVEAAVRESGLVHYTILAPPVLNYDYLMPTSAGPHTFAQLPRTGTLETALDDGVTMPYLGEGDVGKYAAAALLDPARFSGHEIGLASDNLTAQDVCDILSRVSGIDIKLHKRTPAEKEEAKTTAFFQAFEVLANLAPHRVDVDALEKKYGIKLTTFEEYMEKNKGLLLDSLPPRSAAALAAL